MTHQPSPLPSWSEILQAKDAEIEKLRFACSKESDEICQILGKALGYPWFKDDQNNFPGATEEDGVCVGEHVAITLAMEAAKKIEGLKQRLNAKLADHIHGTPCAEIRWQQEKETLEAEIANLRSQLSDANWQLSYERGRS